MTGAAGGLCGGLWAAHGAVLEPGAKWVLDALDFDERMRASRAVVTGEGKLDEQTLEGKLVGEIGTRARQAGRAAARDRRHRPRSTRSASASSTSSARSRRPNLEELEAAGEALGRELAEGRA